MVSQETQPVGTVQDLSLSSDTGVNDDSNPQQGKPHLHSQQSRNHCRGYISSTKRDSRKLFVGGLPGHVNLQEFHAFFEQFGTVIDSVVMMDRETKRSRGFGFVTFQDEAVAKNVLSMGHDEETDEDGPRKGKVLILGKECEVKAAEPKSMSTSCTNPTTKTKRKQERASKIMKAQGNNSNNVTGTEFAGNEEPFLYNMIGNHGNYVDLYSSLPPPEVVPVMMMMPQQGYYYPSPAVPSFHEPYYYQPYPVAEAVAPNAVAWYPQPTPVDFYSPYVGQAGIPAMPGVGAPAPILTGSFLPDNGAFTHVDVIPTTTQAFVPPSPPLETKANDITTDNSAAENA
mmetsp:Transcript_28113/g.51203  ORF Transcript_28113/g.51203 Transcript_28113/m.51203 type:complete len:342 (-) Transcript_28113:780-1805(-)